jgi:hypothetical protein
LSTALPPAYPSGNVSISKQPSYAQSVAQQNWAGLLMMPGFTASTTVYGSHIEPYPATANLQPVGAFSYGIVTAQLQNYYDATGQPGVYPQTGNLGLALVDPTANGNGSNGIFHYFSDHDRCYQRLITSFPSNSMPAPNSYDPANQRYEATIYGWDTGVNGTC